jgi:TonB family protein
MAWYPRWLANCFSTRQFRKEIERAIFGDQVGNMVARKLWPSLVLIAIPAFASVPQTRTSWVSSTTSVVRPDAWLLKTPVRSSEFADVPHTSARSRCEATQPPEALTTPNPIMENTDPSLKIKVSFIVGTDGRVHSPLILESSGTSEDHAILNTVRAWRYRPATCNGVPTETEGKVEFSSR